MDLTRRSFLAALGITAAAPIAAKAGLLADLPAPDQASRFIDLHPIAGQGFEQSQYISTIPGATMYSVSSRLTALPDEDAYKQMLAAMEAGEEALFRVHLRDATMALKAIPTGLWWTLSVDGPFMDVELADVRISAQ